MTYPGPCHVQIPKQKPRHSTGTAVLGVENDIDHVFGNRKGVLLVLLDLPDTVNHSILLRRMISRVVLFENLFQPLRSRMITYLGVSGCVHEWFKSYLSGSQTGDVMVNESSSDPIIVFPQLFCIYLLLLGKILRRHVWNKILHLR